MMKSSESRHPAENRQPLESRIGALDLLDAVLHRKRPLDEALETVATVARLEGRDRAFARNLAATTLRRLGQVDDLVGRCLEKPLPRRAVAVRDILRLGCVQLVFLGTPAHAAVHTSVQLTRQRRFASFAGLVNAVLRRLDRDGAGWLAEQDAARLNTPDWLWDSWRHAYGAKLGRAIAVAHLTEAPLDITVKGGAPMWAERLGAKITATHSLRLTGGGPVTGLAGFDEGAWWVQDMAAALPARLLGNVAGKNVIDLCAAPGGKTAQLAARGARVTAVDRAPKRLHRLKDNLDRLGLTAEMVTADAATWRPAEKADAVLLDAPCTTTGTIRRHPDVARLKKPEDVDRLAAVQGKLLAAAVDMVRPGGRLIYCACTLQPEEGPEVIAALLAGGAPVERQAITADEIGGLKEAVSGQGDLRTLPCHRSESGGMDGFFAARLVRR